MPNKDKPITVMWLIAFYVPEWTIKRIFSMLIFTAAQVPSTNVFPVWLSPPDSHVITLRAPPGGQHNISTTNSSIKFQFFKTNEIFSDKHFES